MKRWTVNIGETEIVNGTPCFSRCPIALGMTTAGLDSPRVDIGKVKFFAPPCYEENWYGGGVLLVSYSLDAFVKTYDKIRDNTLPEIWAVTWQEHVSPLSFDIVLDNREWRIENVRISNV